MKENVSVVIVHFNTPESLKRSLATLYSTSEHVEVIVVDNASTKKIESVKQMFPRAKWIENELNFGFSFANNQGFLHSHGRWLLFLNADVEMSSKQVYDMFRFAEQEGLDALSPTPVDGRYQKNVPTFQSILQEFSSLHRVIGSIGGEMTLTGGCLMINRRVFEQIGGWDERFFLWFEDSDLTRRLIDHGAKIGFFPQLVKHTGGDSVRHLTKQLQRDIFFCSLDIYIRKHFPHWQQKIIRKLVIWRFTKLQFYPTLNKGSSWVVPNMKRGLLDDFFEMNRTFFDAKTQLIIVSSALNPRLFWKYKHQHPTVRFILLPHNKGFSSTVNAGFRASTSQYVGTVNDDVILNKQSFYKLLRYAKAGFGSLNPVITSLNGEVESAGIQILKKGKAIPITKVPFSDLKVVDATNGACVLYSREALQKTGLFDERFGSYLEDIDLSMRLKKARYANVVVTGAHLIHTKHQTSKSFGSYKQWLDMKNWWLISIKHYTAKEWATNFPVILFERARNLSGFLKRLAKA